MEDRETPRMQKYGESKTTRIMTATVPHVTAWAEGTKYQADGFLFNGVYICYLDHEDAAKSATHSDRELCWENPVF